MISHWPDFGQARLRRVEDKMNKSRQKFLRRLDGKEVRVFSDHDLVAAGLLSYKGTQCYVGRTRIPIRPIRNVAPWSNGDSKALIFVDSAYNLGSNL